MFDLGQPVLVIADKVISYEGIVTARATGDDGGTAAYQVALRGGEQLGQWHKACDVFVVEEAKQEEADTAESFLKG